MLMSALCLAAREHSIPATHNLCCVLIRCSYRFHHHLLGSKHSQPSHHSSSTAATTTTHAAAGTNKASAGSPQHAQDYQVVQLPPHTSQAATAQQLLQQQQLQLPPQQQRYQQLPPQLRMDSNVRSIRHAAGAASAAALFALPQQKQQQQLSWQRLGLRWLHGDCEPDTAACIKPPHPSQLTQAIKAASTLQDLQQLLHQHSSALNHIHCAAAVAKLARWQQAGKLKPQNSNSCRDKQQPVSQLLHQIELLLLEPQLLNSCNCWSLAYLVWGLGALGHTRTGLFAACLQQFMQKLPEAQQAQDVAMVLVGVAKAGQQLQQDQLQQLLAAAVDQLPTAKPQELANAVWAVATILQGIPQQQQVPLPDSQLKQLQQLVSAFAQQVPSAKPQEVSNTLWGCAVLRIDPADLFAALDSQQRWDRLLPGMESQHLANTAFACAVLDYRNTGLLRGLLDRALQMQQQQQQQQQEQQRSVNADSSRHELSAQGVSILCWSMAVLDVQPLADSVVQLVKHAACDGQWRNVTKKNAFQLVQLQQVHQWLLDQQLAGGKGLGGALTQQQLQQCREAAAAQMAAEAAKPPSEFQRDVFAALQQLTASSALTWQQRPAMEQPAEPDAACMMDIAGVLAGGVRLAIEIDGPSHFLWPDVRPTGSTQHRNRVLAARGYAAMSVPYVEWNGLRSARDKQQYLSQCIWEAVLQQQQRQQQQ